MALNPFENLPLDTLQRFQTAYEAAVLAIAQGAQSYTLNGVSVSRANLDSVKDTLGQIALAIRLQNGTAVRFAHPITRPLF